MHNYLATQRFTHELRKVPSDAKYIKVKSWGSHRRIVLDFFVFYPAALTVRIPLSHVVQTPARQRQQQIIKAADACFAEDAARLQLQGDYFFIG